MNSWEFAGYALGAYLAVAGIVALAVLIFCGLTFWKIWRGDE